jgi:hypothetical protein
MSPVVYAILCVVVPLAWGALVAFVSNRIERAAAKRRDANEAERPLRRTEYHI